MKHRVALAGVFAAVLVTSACSGGNGSSSSSTPGSTAPTTTAAATGKAGADPIEWTGTFCEGVGPAVEGVFALLKTMFEGGADNPALQKAALLDYNAKAGKALADAGAKLEDLGAPSPENQELHDELVKFFTDTGNSLTKSNAELVALDPADPEFATKLEQLGGDQADPSKLQEQIKKLQEDPKLGDAFRQAPACVAMTEMLESLGS
ncbi:hypothetical protein [Saccharothrix sp. NRRL B-16348]|uniref:hypothetical protein n=1 Tax=Saccharothrix sp. NRRL B-16348 TaxID=1415542 RepID=UPI0006AFE465|nr:hypothetical protein [Saccharothrix sp. NRRL B-16348]